MTRVGRLSYCARSVDGLAALGRTLAGALKEAIAGRPLLLLALDGELGTGKTTLAAATLAALGVRSRVTSPTYGLVHAHMFTLAGTGRKVEALHVDLYRLRHLAELDELGLEDGVQSTPAAACQVLLVEWFENARGRLGSPDLAFRLKHAKPGRLVNLRAHSTTGGRILRSLRGAAHPELQLLSD
ncbi:MAG: tRNA (adenosine(37)-N6)-threonylcarbamoyltransferase complex ATPase subunit type 1 TsaE [Gammaproteobacteria bacterium]|nr:tRNA (adenosine(37)-N6)-threonylcarbamoyltransferase complex ATPase subunit type 1 TsaE [Gammaproteobacteria bacterium]